MDDALLTNREIASLVTLAAFVMLAIVAVVRDGSGGQILQAGRSAFATLVCTKIPLLFAGYVGCIAATVALANRWWLWDTALLKATVVWCLISGIGLFGKAFSAVEERGVFVGALKRVIAAVVVFQFIANLASFPLWVEIPAGLLASLCTLLAAFGSRDAEHAGVVKMANSYLGIFGVAAIGWAAWRLVDDWSDTDRALLLREFLLPLWLTPVALLLIYPLSWFAAYEGVRARMRFAANGRPIRAQRLAVMIRSAGRLGALRELQGTDSWRLGRADGFRAAWREIGDIKQDQREEREAQLAAGRRLELNADLVGTDSSGKQLDQREHAETMQALRWLATCQMGHYRNRGNRYYAGLEVIIDDLSDKYGLPRPNGVEMHISRDGQSWYAARQTITGHWFAIGAAGPPSDQWLYDGSTAPSGFPDEAEWEHWAPGDNAPNWT